MATDAPDIAGFADAQRRLREALGRVVTFYTPNMSAAVWDSSVGAEKFDPETHLPYDPTIEPLPIVGSAAEGLPDDEFPYVTASATCSVVFQPLTAIRRDETQADAFGGHTRLNKDLIADPDDLAVFGHARYFRLDDETWKIVSVNPDGIGGLQRYVIFGQATR